ncbi:hypothetical protein EVAR_17126_1 [Eumeta japonica]|uniref:Uncharacterized protein n=1 Tax=Eumeta variegata TaxID=151549 RepID=A0A4C1UNK2_EUMVA|nr:hypothetical protein EVAR_17126_1 [Eumeta japonica]
MKKLGDSKQLCEMHLLPGLGSEHAPSVMSLILRTSREHVKPSDPDAIIALGDYGRQRPRTALDRRGLLKLKVP